MSRSMHQAIKDLMAEIRFSSEEACQDVAEVATRQHAREFDASPEERAAAQVLIDAIVGLAKARNASIARMCDEAEAT